MCGLVFKQMDVALLARLVAHLVTVFAKSGWLG